MKRQLVLSQTRTPGKLKVTNQALDGYGRVNTKYDSTVDESKVLAQILSRPDCSLLPYGTIWASADRNSLLIKEDAGYKSINFKMGKQGGMGAVVNLTLPLPELVYGISPGTGNVPYVSHIWTPKHYKKENVYLFRLLPLPNVHKSGAVCTHYIPEMDPDLPFSVKVNLAIAEYWGSIFNYDVEESKYSYFYKALRDTATLKSYDDGNKYDVYSAWSKFYDLNSVVKYDHGPGFNFDQVKQMLIEANALYMHGGTDGVLFFNKVLLATMD